MTTEGSGVCRVDNMAVFVPHTAVGDRIRVRIVKVLKSYAFGIVEELLEPSADRIAPACGLSQCGGCLFQHITYDAELRVKEKAVQDAFIRLGKLSPEFLPILGAESRTRYRNKAQYPVSPDGRIGFYRARTHEVIDTRECLLVKPEADAAAEAVRQYMRDFRAAGYDERTGRGLLRHVYVRSNTRGECLICLLVNGKRLPHEAELVERLRCACPKAVGIVLGENTRRDNVILGERYRTLWGADRLEDVLCGRVFRLSVPSFYQVNREQAERLYAKAIEYAQLTGEETVLDLYCGAGTITLALASHAKRVLGAEIADMETQRDALKEQIARSEETIAVWIAGIEDNTTRLVFRLRFIRGMPWKVVASVLGGRNSEDGVKSICYRFLGTCPAMTRADAL